MEKIKNNFIKILVVLLFVPVMFLGACSQNPDNNTPAGPTSDPNSNNFGTTSFTEPIQTTTQTTRQELAEDYLSAIANVYLVSNASTQNESLTFSGSGVAVYAGGYIATNWHVVESAISNPASYSIKVGILSDEETGEIEKYNAKILWSNINFDIAILKCEYPNIPFVKMKDRWTRPAENDKLKIAEEIWVLGTPRDSSLFGTYTQGFISSPYERISIASNRVYESLIQHSAPTSNGSSGSGVFDASGNLIALTTLGINGSSSSAANDIYFATPIFPVINIIGQIATFEEDGNALTNYAFPQVGVTGYDKHMSSYYSDLGDFEDNGVYVQEVSNPGACYGKLNAGDVIVGISNKNSNQNSSNYFEINKRNDLLYALSEYKSGDEIKVYYKRGNISNFTTITLG